MIAKIMKGSGFKGIINYILDTKKGTELIDSSGGLCCNGSQEVIFLFCRYAVN